MCWVVKFSDVPQCQKFFLEGKTPNLPDILVDGIVKDQNRYKPICQLFNNIYRFATLYDTTNRIPVFSAYTFSGRPTDCRPKHQPWMMEPQLNGENNSPEMQNSGRKIEYQHQAGNDDYINSTQKKGVNRGHLFPCSHAHDLDTQKSTFTLTNIVPQVVSFNNGSWREMEEHVREKLETDCINNNRKIKAYVVTGAVPSDNNKLNNRVNIPGLMWTAYCCYNNNLRKWVARAHWGQNQKEGKGKTLPSETLADLYNMLNPNYPGGVQVFPEQCPTGVKPTTTSTTTTSTPPHSWRKYLDIISFPLRHLYNALINHSRRFFG
ncbi:endonuclease domain-containing 1 protein-like [Oncorhynchus nerka]|uniref:endonuclease domain-containing 1 protein-like n=1 Tax=Oncorhynchus nerka TaxID=8023 RepID=UPI0031B803D9